MDIYYALEDSGRCYESIEELAEHCFNDCTYQTDSINVCEMKRMIITYDSECLLDIILERLDEEYTYEELEPTKPTKILIEAAEKFIAVLKSEFKPTLFEANGKKHTVKLSDYL